MKFDLYRHPDGTITSIACHDTIDGKISLQESRDNVFPSIQRIDSNGNILLGNDGKERKAFLSVPDFLVLLYMRTDGKALGRTQLINQLISFCEASEWIDTSDNPEWNTSRDRIRKFTFANKFTGPSPTIINACTAIGDRNVFDTWLKKVNTAIALICNCSETGFRLPDYNSLLTLQAKQAVEFKENFAERYIHVPDKDTTFRTASLHGLTKLLEGGDQFALKGQALTGKTTALKLITKTLSQNESQYLPIYIDLRDTWLLEDHPIKRFIERAASETGNCVRRSEKTEKRTVLIVDGESGEVPDNLKNEIREWGKNGVKILTTCALEGSIACYLAPMTGNCLAEYLNFSKKNIHLPSYSPLRELPILHLYKSLLDSSDIAESVEVTKWNVLNSYFNPAFSGTPLPPVGFYSECMEDSSRRNALAAVNWYISRSGNDEQKRALQGKYLFQWGAVEFILQIFKSEELCVDAAAFRYSDCTSWGELLYESLKDFSAADILQSSFDRNEEYHQFVLKCLYAAYYSYIDSLRNEDKLKVKRCEEVKDSLYRIFKLEFEYINTGKTDCKSVFLQMARLCGEVFRRCFQFEKVESIRRMVYSLFTDDAEQVKYRLPLLSIDNNTAKAKRARAVMMYAQQERVGSKGLKMVTIPKDSAEYKEKKEQMAPSGMKSFMSPSDADRLRELLFCCKENVAELGEKQYDYIIVLGSNSIEANCEQLISAVTSGHLEKGGKVILSGRYPENREGAGTKTEAKRMLRYLENDWERLNGMLEPNQILLEEESTNAKENIICSFKLLQTQRSAEPDHPYHVLIIAKAFMTYRVKMYLAYWVGKMNVEADYLGVTEPEGTSILHIGKNDFDSRPDSAARIYEEAIRLIKFSQYRTDGNMIDLELSEATGTQLLEMLNRISVFPDFFAIERRGKSEAVMYNLYLSNENR